MNTSRIGLALLTAATVLSSVGAQARDGYDWKKHRFIEIPRGQDVIEGETVEFYEYGRGYREAEVQSIDGDEIEIIDEATGELRVFDMD